ncbi:glyoxal reductase-like [Anthonomus grandis grandis]|uniref:glyoxal reductase-like n=1 Tax=Anthonomus grandis grandis TaxID=2921223 RepID=UPI0021652FB7|nr:glyoxal reductase-like [Anthonomus grandis grandis]
MATSNLLFLCVTSVVLMTGGTQELLAKNMKFKLQGGDLMPMVGFGTYQIRGTELIRDVLDYALGAGYRLIDTAKVYRNEEDIGKALKDLLPKYNLTRKDIWITTKLSPDDQGAQAYEALKESVKKLDCGYVDLYLIHWPGSHGVNASNTNNSRLRDESWKQMVKGLKEGLAKNIGVSNYLVRHLKELAANNYGIKPAVNQVEWHPHYHPQDLLDYCRQEGILLQAYSSLGGTGNPDLIKDPTVEQIAEKLNKTPAQILLRWALQQNIAIIPKARSEKHIRENIDLDFDIPEEDMRSLSSFKVNKYAWDPENIA